METINGSVVDAGDSDSGTSTPVIVAPNASTTGWDSSDAMLSAENAGQFVSPPKTPSQLSLADLNVLGFSTVINDSDALEHISVIENVLKELRTKALHHFSATKSRITEHYNAVLSAKENAYNSILMEKNAEIARLMQDILNLEQSRLNESTKLEQRCDQLAAISSNRTKHYEGNAILLKKFYAWKQCATESTYVDKMDKGAAQYYRHRLLSKVFTAIVRASNHQIRVKLVEEAKHRENMAMKEIIIKYEQQVNRLRGELHDARRVSANELEGRKQLKEDLERLFLKNMTTMNMEALSLFNKAAGMGAGSGSGSAADGLEQPVYSASVSPSLGVLTAYTGISAAAPVPLPAPGVTVTASRSSKRENIASGAAVSREPLVPLPNNNVVGSSAANSGAAAKSNTEFPKVTYSGGDNIVVSQSTALRLGGSDIKAVGTSTLVQHQPQPAVKYQQQRSAQPVSYSRGASPHHTAVTAAGSGSSLKPRSTVPAPVPQQME